jgi:hypothetical protein
MRGSHVSEKMLGYCGYNCHLCAARSDDPAVRQKLVEGWRALFGHEHYTAENVRCDGCRSDGRVADRECRARPCARERGVDSCAACDDFPCDKMRHLMASREGLLIYCVRGKDGLNRADYDLCARQFESMPNLVRELRRAGRLPEWAGSSGAEEGD